MFNRSASTCICTNENTRAHLQAVRNVALSLHYTRPRRIVCFGCALLCCRYFVQVFTSRCCSLYKLVEALRVAISTPLTCAVASGDNPITPASDSVNCTRRSLSITRRCTISILCTAVSLSLLPDCIEYFFVRIDSETVPEPVPRAPQRSTQAPSVNCSFGRWQFCET